MNTTLDENTKSLTISSENPTSVLTVVNNNVFNISLDNAVSELIFKPSNITIQLNKKLNWFQRMCYTALGFEYKTL